MQNREIIEIVQLTCWCRSRTAAPGLWYSSPQIETGVETTKINGRLTLMHNIVRFFEFDMIVVLNTIFGVLGSLYFLSLVSWPIVGFLLISGLAILAASYYYSPKLAAMTRLNNDISEHPPELPLHTFSFK